MACIFPKENRSYHKMCNASVSVYKKTNILLGGMRLHLIPAQVIQIQFLQC